MKRRAAAGTHTAGRGAASMRRGWIEGMSVEGPYNMVGSVAMDPFERQMLVH